MYHYVEDKEFLNQAKKFSSILLKDLEDELRKKGMNTQYFLIGSGARNMVAQNENGPIDFDYNLNIVSCADWNDGKAIKELVRMTFNAVLRDRGLEDCDDSTSSLTTKLMYFKDKPSNKFSIDIGIVTKNNGEIWERLIHDKKSIPNRYFWNQAPNSKGYADKAKKIKDVPGMWDKLRTRYLEKKNIYLTRNDYNHPSFICYIESVNEIYSIL